MTQMRPTLVRMPAELLAEIDAARGDVPRAVWIRRVCERAIAEGTAFPFSMADITREALRQMQERAGLIVEDDPLSPKWSEREVAAMKAAPKGTRFKAVADPVINRIVQVGPVAPKPGSRLKKGKK